MAGPNLVAVSGGYDPLHVGHLAQLQTASALAGHEGRVLIFLNSDAWLQHKKGYVFMPWTQRREILLHLRTVDLVVAVNDHDGTVAEGLRLYQPRLFVKGGDRLGLPPSEAQACKEIGCQVVFGAGGPKVASSQALIRQASRHVTP